MKKIFISCISFLCICVVLMSVWVIPSSAIAAPNGGYLMFNYAVLTYNNYSTDDPGTDVGYVTNINPDNAVDDVYYSVGAGEYDGGNYLGVLARVDVLSSNNSVLFEAGNDYSYSFNGIVYNNNANSYNVSRVDYYFRYSDGTNSGSYIQAPNSSVTFEGNFDNSIRQSFKVSLNFNPQKDVTRVWVRVFFRLNTGPDNRATFNIGYGNPQIDITKQGNDNSILATIRDWLSAIYNTLVGVVGESIVDIASIVNNIYTTISSRLSSVVNYLNNIYNALFNTIGAKLTEIIGFIVGTDTQPGLVSQITDFFSDLKDTVIDFIQSIITGEIIEDLHTLISGSLLELPNLNDFTKAVTDYLTEEGNLLGIIGKYDNFVDDFYNDVDIGTEDIPFGIGKGLLVASACVTYISTEIPLVNELLVFGLAVGLVGFVIGSSWLVGSFISSHRYVEHKTILGFRGD